MPDFTGNWLYLAPTEVAEPGAGEAAQATNSPTAILFHKTDFDTVDQSANLLAVTDDDTITTPTMSWTVTAAPVDGGPFVLIPVTPATQDLPDGTTRLFTFTEFAGVNTPPTLEDLRRYVGATSTQDDELLEQMLVAATEWCAQRVYPADLTSSTTVANAILLQSSRWYKRRQSPEGVAGFASEGFVVRVGRFDPDIIASLARNMDTSDTADTGLGVG